MEQARTDAVVAWCGEMRGNIQDVANDVKLMKGGLTLDPLPGGADVGEVMANITLAYRHLEDAKMRIGKVIQAIEGVSVYDTKAN